MKKIVIIVITLASISFNCAGCTSNDPYDYYDHNRDEDTIISHSSEESAQIEFEEGKIVTSEFNIKGKIQNLDISYKDVSFESGEIVAKITKASGEELITKSISTEDEKEGVLAIESALENETCQIVIDATGASSGSITFEWAYEQ